MPAKNLHTKNQTKITSTKHMTDAEKLANINKYQEQYFTIVKRNDLFLNIEENNITKKDRKELDKLFKKVKNQINNQAYLKKYNDIEKRYSECSEITTPGMNNFAKNNYNEVDALLNEVYKEVQAKISHDNFKNLTISETKWLKEVEDYEEIFNSKNFGTIRTLIYYDYEINMKNFRTLLLMLYL